MLRSQSVYGRRAVVAARESYVCLLVHVTGSNAAGDRWQSLQKSRSSSKGCSRLGTDAQSKLMNDRFLIQSRPCRASLGAFTNVRN